MQLCMCIENIYSITCMYIHIHTCMHVYNMYSTQVVIQKSCNYLLIDKTIFGGNLATNVLKHGTALPPLILQAMDHLKATGEHSIVFDSLW